MLCDCVTYEIAKLLENRIYSDNKYAAEDVTVTWDNMLGVGEFKEGELIDDGDNIHGKTFEAPTYAEVLDYLKETYGVLIKFYPVYTFSTKDHIAYYITAYKLNKHDCKLEEYYKDDLYMYTLECGIETVLKEVLEDGREEEG